MKGSCSHLFSSFCRQKKFVVDAGINKQDDRWLAKDSDDVPVVMKTKSTRSVICLTECWRRDAPAIFHSECDKRGPPCPGQDRPPDERSVCGTSYTVGGKLKKLKITRSVYVYIFIYILYREKNRPFCTCVCLSAGRGWIGQSRG